MIARTVIRALEWIRPAGISLVIFCAYLVGNDPQARFHIMGPFVVMIMSGSVAFESLLLGEAAAEKIGYAPNRAYQVQSGLANAATALTALLVYLLKWGVHAEAAIVIAMLLFFCFSGANHLFSAIRHGNMKPVNLMRPLVSLLLAVILLPAMVAALR